MIGGSREVKPESINWWTETATGDRNGARTILAPAVVFDSSREDDPSTKAAEPISHEFIHMRSRENTPRRMRTTRVINNDALTP